MYFFNEYCFNKKPNAAQNNINKMNVPSAIHSIESAPLKVVVPLTVATTPNAKITIEIKNNNSKRRCFSGKSQRMP